MANYKKLILFLLALSVAPFSYAGIETLFDRHGFAIYPATNSVTAQITNNMAATAVNGTRAVVPVTTAVQVSRGVMALNAAKLASKAIPIASAAFLGYQIYDAIKSTGVTTCAPPNFFCTPDVPGASVPAVDGLWQWTGAGDNRTYARSSPQGVCDMLADIYAGSFPTSNGWTYRCIPTTNTFTPQNFTWWADRPAMNGVAEQHIAQGDIKPVTTGTCTSGTYNPSTGSCAGAGQPGAAFADDQALADAMQANDWGPALSKKIWDAIQADMDKAPGTLSFKDALGAQSPVTVSGPPVTTPEVVTSSKTTPNPDGSTSTTVKKDTTTFTPAKDGSTVSDAVPKVSQSTVTTTTVTNNTTNVTNTTTTTSTPPKSAAEEKSDLCKDNPDIVACQKLGKLEATPVPNENKPLAITTDSGWGSSNAACPSPGSITAMGKTIAVPWDVFCQFAQGIRPFLLAVAYMIAVGGFLGLSKKG